MSNAQMFFNMAICESDSPKFNNDPAAIAVVRVMGAIGQPQEANDRDGFIKLGFDYLDRFDETAERAIEDIEQYDEPRQDVIQEIRELQKRAKHVELAEFFQLLADDWDERNDSE